MKKQKKVAFFVRIDENNKKFIVKRARNNGFTTISDYINTLFGDMRKRELRKNAK